MERFRQIFTGLMRAHGCTYVDKKGADGLKVKGKSFVKREPVTEELLLLVFGLKREDLVILKQFLVVNQMVVI